MGIRDGSRHKLAVAVGLAAMLAFLSLMDLPAPAHADRWVIECVECKQTYYSGTDRSLQTDADGNLHLAYGGDHLYYAFHNQDGWRYEIVDRSSKVGSGAALDVDPSGIAHIVYFDSANRALKYARRDPAGWHIETIAEEVLSNSAPSLRVDPAGRPHISYVEVMGVQLRDVKYAHSDGAGWQVETVATGLNLYNASSSLALDSNGAAHIAFYDSTTSSLQYAYRIGPAWHVETVDTAGDVGEDPSLSLDAQDEPHIAYFDESNRDLKYAHRSSAGWQVEVVDPDLIAPYGLGTSLAIDGNGYARISYIRLVSSLTYEVWQAYQDASGWHVEPAYSGGDIASSTSIVVDVSGRSHITYIQVFTTTQDDTKSVQHLYRDTVGWQMEVVDRQGHPGRYASIALNSAGDPRIAYLDGDGIDLKYAYLDSAGWHVQVADGAGSAGYWASLALDAAGGPHISYCGPWPSHPLQYAYLDAAGWLTETIDAELAMLGGYPALAFDPTAGPRIAYFDYGVQEIKYAYHDAGGWQFETVEGDGFVGKYHTSIALDESGRPHVSFFNRGDYSLHYAYRDDGGVWHPERVVSMGDYGSDADSTSLAVDGNGYPHIAYYDAANDYLGYAYKDADGWHFEVPDDNDHAGTYVSLALDSLGRAHIAYMDAYPDYDLKYAYRDTDGWHTTTVDSVGEVGRYVSLALDGDDTPHVAYYDATEQCLKYAYHFRADYSFYLPLAWKQ